MKYCPQILPQLHAGLSVIVGQCPDNDSNKMSHRLTWCNKEVKCLGDILANKHISHLLDITHNNSEVSKIVSKQTEAQSNSEDSNTCARHCIVQF